MDEHQLYESARLIIGALTTGIIFMTSGYIALGIRIVLYFQKRDKKAQEIATRYREEAAKWKGAYRALQNQRPDQTN